MDSTQTSQSLRSSPLPASYQRMLMMAASFAGAQAVVLMLMVVLRNPVVTGLGSVALLGSFAAAVYAASKAYTTLVAPIEREVGEAKTLFEDSQRSLHAIFDQNPDAISLYRLDGKMIRRNEAAKVLHDDPDNRFEDQHFTAHVHNDSQEDVKEAFRAAARGQTRRIESLYRKADGGTVEVAASLFPNIVKGEVVGVYGIAKNIGALKKAEKEGAVHRRRLEQLYNVAASTDRSWRQRVEDAIELGRSSMNFDFGFALEMLDGSNSILCGVGASSAYVYTATPVEAALLKRALATNDLVAVMDIGSAVMDEATKSLKLAGAFAAMPITVEGRCYGAIGFTCSDARPALSASDRNLMKLIGALVSSSIENGKQRAKLDELAFNDSLTGLPNRSSLETRLQNQLEVSSRHNGRFAVHFIDLDGFKDVNDAEGHAVGDELLRIAARRMQTTLRGGDLLARIGGDEFVVIQPDMESVDDATGLAARLMKRLAEPFHIEGTSFTIGASVGIAMFPEHAGDTSTLLRAADAALYVAKRSGRGRVVIATTQSEFTPQGAVA